MLPSWPPIHHAGWSLSEEALVSAGHDCRPPEGREETYFETLTPWLSLRFPGTCIFFQNFKEKIVHRPRKANFILKLNI